MAGITFDELWESLKNESEESREFFQTAENVAKIINRLTEERVHQGLSQRDLAKLCGLKQSAIARLESVKSIPRLDTVVKVASALGMDLKLEDKTRIESITITIPAVGITWFNTNRDRSPYSYNDYNKYSKYRISAEA